MLVTREGAAVSLNATDDLMTSTSTSSVLGSTKSTSKDPSPVRGRVHGQPQSALTASILSSRIGGGGRSTGRSVSDELSIVEMVWLHAKCVDLASFLC